MLDIDVRSALVCNYEVQSYIDSNAKKRSDANRIWVDLDLPKLHSNKIMTTGNRC